MFTAIIRFFCLFSFSLFVLALNASSVSEIPTDVVVIRASGEVNGKFNRKLFKGLETPVGGGKVVYILEMDSFGGRLTNAYEAVDSIEAVTDGKVIAFITSKALSAAAMISLACDAIYMKEGATIGDCAPILHTFDGPVELGEKVQSPLRAKFRAMAEKNGYSVVLAEAMITKDLGVWEVKRNDSLLYVDDSTYAMIKSDAPGEKGSLVVKNGQLLTMNAVEAKAYGFSRKTVDDIEQILGDCGITSYSLHRAAPKSFGGWSKLTGFEKMFWFLAIPATLLFLIMSVMTFTGLGGEDLDGGGGTGGDGGGDMGDDVNVDHGYAENDVPNDGGGFVDAFHLFTVRNFIVFFMMFGWSGIAMVKSSASPVASILVAALIGIVMMFIVSFLFYLVSRLVHSGNIATRTAVGATGTVYLTIPKSRSGSGKVTVVVGGSKVEFKAMTDGKEIATGESIKVRDLIGGDVLLVDKFK